MHDVLGVCISDSGGDGGGERASIVEDVVSVVSIFGGGVSLGVCVVDGLPALPSPMFFLLSKIEFLSKNRAIAAMIRRTIMVEYDRFGWMLRFIFFIVFLCLSLVVWMWDAM